MGWHEAPLIVVTWALKLMEQLSSQIVLVSVRGDEGSRERSCTNSQTFAPDMTFITSFYSSWASTGYLVQTNHDVGVKVEDSRRRNQYTTSPCPEEYSLNSTV